MKIEEQIDKNTASVIFNEEISNQLGSFIFEADDEDRELI